MKDKASDADLLADLSWVTKVDNKLCLISFRMLMSI